MPALQKCNNSWFTPIGFATATSQSQFHSSEGFPSNSYKLSDSSLSNNKRKSSLSSDFIFDTCDKIKLDRKHRDYISKVYTQSYSSLVCI